jgi:regulatory protein
MTPEATRPAPSLKARALRHLSRREHSRVELARKLSPHEPDVQVLEALLDDLEAQGWLSDARYAESLVRSRAAGSGSRKLRAELQSRGVDPEVVETAMAQTTADEPARAQAYWDKKFGRAPSTPEERARQFRHLLARGFAAEVVRRVVPGLRMPQDD